MAFTAAGPAVTSGRPERVPRGWLTPPSFPDDHWLDPGGRWSGAGVGICRCCRGSRCEVSLAGYNFACPRATLNFTPDVSRQSGPLQRARTDKSRLRSAVAAAKLSREVNGLAPRPTWAGAGQTTVSFLVSACNGSGKRKLRVHRCGLPRHDSATATAPGAVIPRPPVPQRETGKQGAGEQKRRRTGVDPAIAGDQEIRGCAACLIWWQACSVYAMADL